LAARKARTNLAAQLNLATSTALTNQNSHNNSIVVAYLNSRATSPSSYRAAFRVAGAQKLPILFVCQANKEATIEAEKCQFPSITVDGNDVVAVYRVATETILHARKGSGPTLIEYRLDCAEALDPILHMEAYLKRKGLFRENVRRKAAGFLRKLDAAVQRLPAR
jgi:TPP-dependent pyruvate/acetoin dehydrogenase alpha subunit